MLDNIDNVVSLLKSKNFVYLIGNGGSASTCGHFANDLVTVGIKAISLVDQANITRIANDIDYASVFIDQLRVFFGLNDVLVAISASGNSLNLIRAINYVNSIDGLTIGIVAFNGGVMKHICGSILYVPTEFGEYEEAENKHLEICHTISRRIGDE